MNTATHLLSIFAILGLSLLLHLSHLERDKAISEAVSNLALYEERAERWQETQHNLGECLGDVKEYRAMLHQYQAVTEAFINQSNKGK